MPRGMTAWPEPNIVKTIVLWWIGDQLNYGHAHFSAEREKVISSFPYDKKTIKQAEWLSRAILPNERHPTLTWNHHMVVARKKLSKEERSRWLERAAKEGLSTRVLAKQINAQANKAN